MAVTAPSAAPNPSPPTPAGELDGNRVRQLWKDSVVASIPSRRTKALLLDAQIVAVSGTSLRLSLPSAPLAKMVADESNLVPIRAALQQALGGTWKVDVVVGGAAPPGETPAEEPPAGSGPATWSGAATSTARLAASPELAAQEPPAEPPPPDPDDPRDISEPVGEPDPATGRRVGDPEDLAVGLLRSQLGAKPVVE